MNAEKTKGAESLRYDGPNCSQPAKGFQGADMPVGPAFRGPPELLALPDSVSTDSNATCSFAKEGTEKQPPKPNLAKRRRL